MMVLVQEIKRSKLLRLKRIVNIVQKYRDIWVCNSMKISKLVKSIKSSAEIEVYNIERKEYICPYMRSSDLDFFCTSVLLAFFELFQWFMLVLPLVLGCTWLYFSVLYCASLF